MTIQRDYRVVADGSTDAADRAKQAARDAGRRVKGLCRIDPVDPPVRGTRTVWVVRLSVSEPPVVAP